MYKFIQLNLYFYKPIRLFELTTTIKEAYYNGDQQSEAKTSIDESLFEIK